MMKKLVAMLGLLVAAVLLIAPSDVSARSFFAHASTSVPAGQTVDDVYVVGGDADIRGHVTGAVVVVNGNLHFASTAKADGAIVVIGGRITQDEGAQTGDDIHNLTLDTGTQNSLLIGGGMIAGVWTLQLASSLLLIVLPVSVYFIGGRRASEWVKRQSGLSWKRQLYLGGISGVMLLAFSALCVVTIIGIPFLLLVLLILLAACVVGMTSLSYQIGGFLQEQWLPNDWVRLIVGATLIAAIANIPVIGWLAVLFFTLFSLGAFTQWLASLRRKKPRA
ncbi:hypothetical protein I8J29_02585 [Paenibacillus sp. MWE-103]|uniref:Polymer-forming cytoskeletal protein n=1 Tax=Paenibacillus artemisiicola TaxID=1172618 RepID=A0ABS3W438_9BACL|nr:hypothetical protein [Paenibacillus artemisiicola]MBO7743068.1 hypothetical protein [Paenibacillus artemisiicola]